jgi:ribosomal protein L11 methyltransferase
LSGPAYVEVRVLVPTGWQELAAEVLAAPPSTGVAFGPRSLSSAPVPEGFELVRGFVDARDDGEAWRAALQRALAELAAATGAEELSGLELEFSTLPAEDWATTWRKVWRPTRVGRLCIVSPEHDAPLRAEDVRLELEPGAAFGTGRHATTRACLRELQRRVAPGQRVLDAGCGTGILAVSACLLGAGRALGFDVDRAAVEHSRELAERNGVGDRCEFVQGTFDDVSGRFDGALANLYADLVEAHAGDLAQRVEPGGWFVVSGCPVARRPGVVAALAVAGCAVERRETRGRWDCYAGRVTDRP